VGLLIGDARKACAVLHWRPTVNFGELVTEMVQAEMKSLSASWDGSWGITI
jgi:GDP-D-mannose dehydratase